MTVTLYSLVPPTTSTSSYLLRATPLNGPRTEPLPRRDIIDDARQGDVVWDVPDHEVRAAARVLNDIDDWYDQTIEDDGFLERLDRSAESVRFP